MGAPLSPRHDAPGPTAARHGRQHTAQSSDCSWVTYIPWGSGGAGGTRCQARRCPGASRCARGLHPSLLAQPGAGSAPTSCQSQGAHQGVFGPHTARAHPSFHPPPSFPCCFRSPTSGTARGGWEGPVLPEAVGHGVLPPSCPTTRPHVPPAGATSLPPALCYLQAAEVSSLLSGRGGPASAPRRHRVWPRREAAQCKPHPLALPQHCSSGHSSSTGVPSVPTVVTRTGSPPPPAPLSATTNGTTASQPPPPPHGNLCCPRCHPDNPTPGAAHNPKTPRGVGVPKGCSALRPTPSRAGWKADPIGAPVVSGGVGGGHWGSVTAARW